jgi:glycosyltransferase involved in cell wall biosynthesis
MRGVIVVGPQPPPFHGVTVMTSFLTSALGKNRLLAGYVDTSDGRPPHTLGVLDAVNIWLGVRHFVQFVLALYRSPKAAVYVPISQGRWGFVRDATFLLGARLAGRRRIAHLHGGEFQAFYAQCDRIMKVVIKTALRGVDQAWVLTPNLRDQFRGLVENRRVHVLENAVEDEFSGDHRSYGNETDGFRLLYLSNVFARKGCLDLLNALDEMGDAARGLKVRLVGEIEPATLDGVIQGVTKLIEHGVEVTLIEPRTGDEKRRQFEWADVFVFPPREPEGQPLVLLEAMAARLPIVTTRHTGITDTVEDGVEAVVISPRDTRQLGKALNRLRVDAELRRSLGEAARARYEARYSPERFDRQLTQLIEGA